jgi:hypothetical protein
MSLMLGSARAGALLAAMALAAGAGPAAAKAHGGRPLHASLSGPVEVPPGDPDATGTATVTVNAGQGQVCYTLSVKKMDTANAAHIHKGAAGTAGPPVVMLTPPSAKGTSKGCADADKALAQDLIQNPGDYYVNVHNAAYPAGAVRGQLSK